MDRPVAAGPPEGTPDAFPFPYPYDWTAARPEGAPYGGAVALAGPARSDGRAAAYEYAPDGDTPGFFSPPPPSPPPPWAKADDTAPAVAAGQLVTSGAHDVTVCMAVTRAVLVANSLVSFPDGGGAASYWSCRLHCRPLRGFASTLSARKQRKTMLAPWNFMLGKVEGGSAAGSRRMEQLT